MEGLPRPEWVRLIPDIKITQEGFPTELKAYETLCDALEDLKDSIYFDSSMVSDDETSKKAGEIFLAMCRLIHAKGVTITLYPQEP